MFKKLRYGILAASASGAAGTLIPVAHAGDVGDSVVNAILDVIEKMAFYIGIILLVWSVVMLVLALKNEDADSKSRAIMLVAVSIALISIGTLLDPILTAAGFSGGGAAAS